MEKAINPNLIKFKRLKPNPRIRAWISRIESGASINNILVCQNGDKFTLLKGKSRLMAYLLCNVPEILVDVIQKPKDNYFLDNE